MNVQRRRRWAVIAGSVTVAGLMPVLGVSDPAIAGVDAPVATPIYLDPAYSPKERAADLVSRMTPREKAAQMNSSQSAAIPRLGVAAYGWWNEAAHGVAAETTADDINAAGLRNTTSYPVSLSAGATWNPQLMYREASLISDEAREVVRGNTRDLNFYSPTINLARDPRWGRNDETFGEDPLLTSAIASQFVDGMEGKDAQGRPLPSGDGYLKTSTTVKHYAANNSEYNRRTGSADMDERTLREYYTAQFRDVIRGSDPSSLMTAYNSINGVPVSASGYLLDTLARQTYGFSGFVTSDCDAIREIQAGHAWQPPGYPHPLDEVERHAFANAAGVDLDCQMGYHDEYNYANTIPTALSRGIVTPEGTFTENDVDRSVTRLMATRIRLGEFDDQARVPWVARARSRVPVGTWTNSDANQAVTETPERLAMARKVGDESIVLLKNATAAGRDGSAGPLLPLRVPTSGAYRVAVVGTSANPSWMFLGGYSSFQGAPGMANSVNGYQGVKTAVQAIDPDATVDFLPGVSGSGVDQATLAAVGSYDAVIAYAATDYTTAREDVDRTSLALPGAQAEMIKQVAARNPNTVAYLETVGQVDVAPFADGVGALLWSSYNGQRKGEALADVLLGHQNPSGHLPFTWYADAAQLPPVGDYSIRPTGTNHGRTYMYYTGPVSYPFGYGLSYSTFEYSRLRVDRARVDANETVRVCVDVTNTGKAAGSEVVQLYVATPEAPATAQRPIKRLRGFQKITLSAGQTGTVELQVKIRDLAFYDEARQRYVVDPGRYDFGVGRSSADPDIPQHALVTVAGQLRPTIATVSVKARTASDAGQGIAERVLFPTGTAISPQLTITMSDESRYGPGSSSQLPPGVTVRYTSNRPSVVSVKAGQPRTCGSGVATVTAKVTYRGHTSSTQFVVAVR